MQESLTNPRLTYFRKINLTYKSYGCNVYRSIIIGFRVYRISGGQL